MSGFHIPANRFQVSPCKTLWEKQKPAVVQDDIEASEVEDVEDIVFVELTTAAGPAKTLSFREQQ